MDILEIIDIIEKNYTHNGKIEELIIKYTEDMELGFDKRCAITTIEDLNKLIDKNKP